jgi:INO80 complex subunit C
MHIPKPFKNPAYTKNATRRTQTLKTLLSREKERDKAVRAERKEKLKGPGTAEGTTGGEATTGTNENGPNDAEMQDSTRAIDDTEKMDVDIGEIKVALRKDELELIEEEGITPDDIPSCERPVSSCNNA